uniref:Uncharacterized protein n=1 Tax=Cajanus cajan TaxID=3821 RepID=A0A151TPI0_CAJCA|nr:hypothetical protein KK1_022624 [Cajanus cajan]
MVLVDSGNFHNILQSHLAKHLHLNIEPTQSFSIMVGNRDNVIYNNCCLAVPLTFPTHTFTLPFYLLPNEGLGIVLGIAWLSSIGPYEQIFYS